MALTWDVLVSPKRTNDGRAVGKAGAGRRVRREETLKEGDGRVEDHSPISSAVVCPDGDLPRVDNVGLNGTDLVRGA